MVKRSARDRLRRANGLDDGSATKRDAEKPQAAPVRGGASLRAYLQQRADRGRRSAMRPTEPVELPKGREIENDFGRFFLRRIEVPLSEHHGRHRFEHLAEVDWDRVAHWAKDEAFRSAELSDCLFLDTETTGLSGGAGTMVFLTGLGFVEGEHFVVEQAFLRSMEEERAALLHVAQRMEEFPVPVTFVGKSFDRHRLQSRMVLHDIESRVLTERHLDLYWCARRAWKRRLPDTRLRTVEERRLFVVRDDDLPGSEAPRAWIDWLRDGTGPVDRVLEHNRIDVLSLGTLLVEIGLA
ncbi:MAG: ribonuclease H-like domain-containing protein [Planctomycetota bacterium]